ncbi:MAG: prepilin-type N-terminal cleavage/methylation domain-containing protein [Phycisphaerales bacterium]|nr:MAG: prepilin-type N-terminal cleavage/methylation domain-containing protein [Phycisphaerales bacterium]
MKKQGFTLVELLFVIEIIALLMGILMHALARVRQLAFRLICGTNLSGIGKAMLIYANDYEDELPRAGGRNSEWDLLGQGWMADDRYTAYGVTRGTGEGGKASISSCFYLLVKYAEVTPKSFVCKGDTGTTEFTLADEDASLPADFELIDAWDFGETPYDNCSYSYHIPFGQYALTTSSEPGLAVAADRNPWIESPAADPDTSTFSAFVPDVAPYNGSTEDALKGNAISHQGEGQNVLFLDGHVEFAKRSFCSLEDDNIYTRSNSTTTGDPQGTLPSVGAGLTPANRKDSLLVHDPTKSFGPKRRCFTADTPVWIEGTLVPISRITTGQRVGGSVGIPMVADAGLNDVEAVEIHPGQYTDCYDVVLETGECISAVGSHRFLTEAGRWVILEHLQSGMYLQAMDGPVRIAWVAQRMAPYVGTVYNLKIQDADEYFVGVAGVVVRDY